MDGTTEIGAVYKKYRGFIAEALTTADTFTIRCKTDSIDETYEQRTT